jgi:hypothetical protein
MMMMVGVVYGPLSQGVMMWVVVMNLCLKPVHVCVFLYLETNQPTMYIDVAAAALPPPNIHT